jgi:peroxiredoxin
MRIPALAILLLFITCTSKDQNEFVVEGKIKDAAGTIYLEKTLMDRVQPIIVDSAIVGKNGYYKLTAENTEENLYNLRFGNLRYPFANVVNDAAHITVNADLNNDDDVYTVTGSPASAKLKQFLNESNKQLSVIYAYNVQLDSMRNQGYPDSLLKTVRATRSQGTDSFKNYVVNFLNESKSPAVIMFALGTYQMYASDKRLALNPFSDAQVNEVIEKTAQRFPEHKGIAQLKASFSEQVKNTADAGTSALLNKPAPDFTLRDVNNKNVSLSSFRGKYVLVDFWASWCQPCRNENPNVVSAFKKFSNKNFTVLGVSLDKEREAWINAIREDGLTWTHVSDLAFWNSIVVPMYQIGGIPFNVLIDPNGIIIAENLKGDELHVKLSEILK